LGESLSCVDAGDMCKEQLQSEAQPFDDLLCLVCIKGLESTSQLFGAGDFSCESPTSQSFPIIPNQHPVFHPCFIKDHHEMRRIEGQRRIRCRSHGPWSWDLRTSGCRWRRFEMLSEVSLETKACQAPGEFCTAQAWQMWIFYDFVSSN
jgi:hypothetical protein